MLKDIREDCRYLKNRVSNLESINAKLFHMVQNQHHPRCGHHSCQELFQHASSQSEYCSLNQNDEPRPMFPSMPSAHSYLALNRSNNSLRGHSSVDSSRQAGTNKPQTTADPAFIDFFSSRDHPNESKALDNATDLAVTALAPRKESPGSSPHAQEDSRTDFQSPIHARLLSGCFHSVLEGVLLRASSTPHFSLTDPEFPCLTDPCCETSADDHSIPKVVKLNSCGKSNMNEWQSPKDCVRVAKRRTSFPLPATRSTTLNNGISTTSNDTKDILNRMHGTISPLCRRSLSGVDDAVRSVLLPHAWLHMSILPETAVRRNPIGTRSHIILGARSLPLCINQPVDKSPMNDRSGNQLAGFGNSNSQQTRHNAAVLATIGSPLSSRQTRAFHTQLNPIQEVETKGESYYDLKSDSPKYTSSTTSSSTSSSGVLGATSSESRIPTCPRKLSAARKEASSLQRMRRTLCNPSEGSVGSDLKLVGIAQDHADHVHYPYVDTKLTPTESSGSMFKVSKNEKFALINDRLALNTDGRNRKQFFCLNNIH
ncbi:unnamed protein product [Echinostoma caproni]|uniref:Uncharacterized protein n=1 Tax=Echinostoma caproni TaxID=27848 RepID=A0A183B4U9_9TREM|nr:unnamed protein product [Echinostoma caproni]